MEKTAHNKTFGMFIRAARKRLLAEAAFYSPEECAALAKRMLLAVCAGCRQSLQSALPANEVQLVLAENENILSPVEEECERALERLCKGEPLEYVLGYAEFCGYRFKVNASTLIPRPETEELVSLVGEHLRKVSKETLSEQCCTGGQVDSCGHGRGKDIVVLDLCTGSGCIAWSLLLDYANGIYDSGNLEDVCEQRIPEKQPETKSNRSLNVRFYGCDISEEALELAALQPLGAESTGAAFVADNETFSNCNVERGGGCTLMPPVFFKCNVLAPDAAELISGRIGGVNDVQMIIVCNPPYVCESERLQMRGNVLDWEPSQALFVPDSNPLIFYEAVADLALKFAEASNARTYAGQLNQYEHSSITPALFFEINESLGQQTVEMLKSKGFTNARCLKDLFGKDRFVIA